MRFDPIRLLSSLTLLLALAGEASAIDCGTHRGALGVSRTIVVDPTEHGRIGTMNYAETLPLVDKEVVLTFDDGPLPPFTNRILDILAMHCVRSTFFIVGRMARASPELVRRAQREGHTIGTHSMHHPMPFEAQGLERARWEIDGGIAAIAAALGDAKELAPFFRFPGFGRSEAVERYLAARGLMIWSADVPSDDWLLVGPSDVVQRTLQRLEAKGKGIILLHDIQAKTVAALPVLLQELKTRGYRVVHVQHARADRPKTRTMPHEWRLREWEPILPPLLISKVQNPDRELIAGRSAAELCEVKYAAPKRVLAATRQEAKQLAQVPVPPLAHGASR
jgi:peptidoglycan/xylan/chitin deacetylase (PgdA/CDA1 family)